MKLKILPNEFVPASPKDLLAPASKLAVQSIENALRIKDNPNGHLKICYHGERGGGKTSIVNMVADVLANHPMDIERINGRDVTVEKIRDWQMNSCYGSMFGGWKVKIINELDVVPMAAQDLALSFLDELCPRIAIIGTTNQKGETLSDRFLSRFQPVKVPSPQQARLKKWLVRKWKLPKSADDWIALSSCGDVREALHQATSYLQFGILPEEKKLTANAPAKCASRVASANKYWEEVRAGLRPAPGMGVTA